MDLGGKMHNYKLKKYYMKKSSGTGTMKSVLE